MKHIPSGIVVKCQETRSRPTNRILARRLLAEKLEVMEKGPESRVEMRREGLRKKKASASKKKKRKYRSLAGEEEKLDGDKDDEEKVGGGMHEGDDPKDNQGHASVEKKNLSG